MAVFVVFEIFGVRKKKTMKRKRIVRNMWKYDVWEQDEAF